MLPPHIFLAFYGTHLRQHHIPNQIKRIKSQNTQTAPKDLLACVLYQAVRDFPVAIYRFASANIIFSLAVCFRRPRYRVFLYPNSRFTTAKTCSTFALTDDFLCSAFFAAYCPLLESFSLMMFFYPVFDFLTVLFFTTAFSRFSAPIYPLSTYNSFSSPCIR